MARSRMVPRNLEVIPGPEAFVDLTRGWVKGFKGMPPSDGQGKLDARFLELIHLLQPGKEFSVLALDAL